MPAKVSASTTQLANHCGDSLCGEMKLKPELWGPIAAVAGLAVAGGAAGAAVAGVDASHQDPAKDHDEKSMHATEKEHHASAAQSREFHASAAQSGERHGPAAESRETSPVLSKVVANAPAFNSKMASAGALPSGGTVKSQGFASPVIQSAAPAAPVAGIPDSVVPSAASVTPAPGQADLRWPWLVGGIALCGCCCLCLCGFALSLFLCGDSKSVRKCTRRLCPSLASEPTPRKSKVSPSPLASRERTASDVEDAPLLPEGSALPKFWDWLGNW